MPALSFENLRRYRPERLLGDYGASVGVELSPCGYRAPQQIGEIVRIVEVVNTHNLEPETEAVYRQLQLPVWIYVVRGFGNLEKLRTKRLLHARPLLHDCPAVNARKLAVNSSPEVIVQRFISTPRSLYVVSEQCSRCRTPFAHAFVWDRDVIQPEYFTEQELESATKAGACICPMWIPAYERHIQFNTCPRCKSHMDDFRLNELASKLMLNPEFLRYRITLSVTASKPNAGE